MDVANIVITWLTSAAGMAYVMMFLQKWEKVPWIARDKAWATNLLRALFSLATAVGIHAAWTGSITQGWHITIAVPALGVLLAALWHSFGQFAAQHGILKILYINDPSPVQVHEVVNKAVEPIPTGSDKP